jgi:uncharacterized protein with HEPN domain
MSRDDPLLLDMLFAARRARGHVAGMTQTQFMASELHQDAAIRSLEVIGEAASQVSAEFRGAHSEIPWRDIIGMRNRLIHAYSNISLDTVWHVLQTKLPELIGTLTPLIPPDDAESP